MAVLEGNYKGDKPKGNFVWGSSVRLGFDESRIQYSTGFSFSILNQNRWNNITSVTQLDTLAFDSTMDGKYLDHFGTKGNGLKEFNTAHGMTLDTRYDPPRLLICDRNHQPKGRLLHYDLSGNFLEQVITGLGMPTSVAIQGDHVSVPDLHGRVVILNKSNTIMAVLGHNPDSEQMRNYNVPQSEWIEGIFSGTHGSYWDKHGNLFVQDWNVSGRIMKLERVN